jgi:hypothetical protein
MVADNVHLDYLLNELIESGDVKASNGVTSLTYTITSKGITERTRLKNKIENLK